MLRSLHCASVCVSSYVERFRNGTERSVERKRENGTERGTDRRHVWCEKFFIEVQFEAIAVTEEQFETNADQDVHEKAA